MLTNTLYAKFVGDNLAFLGEAHEKYRDLDNDHKIWCGELVFLYRELVFQVYAVHLYRESGLKNKCLRIDASQAPREVKESLEKYMDYFRRIPDEEIADFLAESLPKMASVQEDLRKLLKIK